MHPVTRFLGACIFAGLLAACSGQNTSTLLPSSAAPVSGTPPGTAGSNDAGTPTSTPVASGPASTTTTTTNIAGNTYTTNTTISGKISALRTGGGLTLLTSGSSGYVPVTYTSTTKVNTAGGAAIAGDYALVLGSGSLSTGITAKYVATFSSAPAPVTITGTYVGPATYGMQVKTAVNGIIPVLVGTTTQISAMPQTGATVTVSGVGSVHAAILASSVTASGSASMTGTPAPASTPSSSGATISQHHVLTMDYLGTPFGTTSVSASRAAPYLSWASTGVTNTNDIAGAGIKTMVYFNVDRLQSTDTLYSLMPESAFDHTCSGSRVTDYFDNVTQYVMNNGSSAMRSVYASYVKSKTAGYHVDAIFEDNAVQLSAYPSSYFRPGPECSYSDATWLADERGLEASAPLPTIFNGMQAFYNHGLAPDLALLENTSTIGGNLETCYVSASSSSPEQTAWVWTATENTELYVGARNKIFNCLAMDTASAPSALQSRIFTIASFLLTYSPSTSMLWENYGTPSRLHVMPESQLVPTDPLVATPSEVSSLQQSTGAYAREYRSCYYAGKLIGACAVVVNSDRYSVTAPHLQFAYHHTLNLHGYGAVDGGTATFDGAAPPTSIPAASAYVAVP